MPRTQSTYNMDTPFTDGVIDYSADDVAYGGAAGPTLVLNAKGDLSWNQAASLAGKYVIPLSTIIERLGINDDLQEQFGSTAGGGANLQAAPSAFTTPAGVTGRPPFAGATELVVPTTWRPKGVKILDYVLHFLIGTNPLTVHTTGLSKTTYPAPGTAAALVVADIIANAANGLPTAANANPQSSVKVVVGSPVFSVTDLQHLFIEVDATTPVGGTYRFYGATLHVAYNYN